MNALITLAAAATLLTGISAVPGAAASPDAAGAKPTRSASVTGSAQIRYHPAPDDDIRFHFDAHAAPFTRPIPEAPSGLPTDARGTVRFSHVIDGTTYHAEAEVDCLLTGGPVATLTAIITSTSHGHLPDGQRLGFSVLDGNHDRMGFSWGLVDGRELRPCLAPAPFAETVRGGFTVRHADVPLSD
jgi:hypothetical protein